MTNGSSHRRWESNVQACVKPYASARLARWITLAAGGSVCRTTPKSIVISSPPYVDWPMCSSTPWACAVPPPRPRRLRGDPAIREDRPMLSTIDRVLAPLTWLIAALVVLLLFAGPSLIGADKEPAPAAAEGGGAQAAVSGSAVFASAGCGGCHTFAAAGASGAVGPNLDDAGADAAGVEAVVRSGRGSMPAFEGQLSDAEIR